MDCRVNVANWLVGFPVYSADTLYAGFFIGVAMEIRHGKKWTFTRVHNPILESDMKMVEKTVYWVLSYFADQYGFCFPSYDKIAKMASCSKRSAIDAVKSLEDNGWITKTFRQNDKGEQTSNGYTIHFEPSTGVQEVHRGGAGGAPRGVQEVHPNESHINENQLTIYGNTEDISEEEAENNEQVDRVIGYFNQKTGKKLRRDSQKYRSQITRAFTDGYSYDDLTAIIDNVADEWPGKIPDNKITPEVVFRPSKMQERMEFARKSAEKKSRSSLSVSPPSNQFDLISMREEFKKQEAQ